MQPSGIILLPISWSFRWSDISSDASINSLSTHIEFFFFIQRQQIHGEMESLVIKKTKKTTHQERKDKTHFAKIIVCTKETSLENVWYIH